jgi:hypothetical protein
VTDRVAQLYPGNGLPFRRLLLLAELRWRYSDPPSRGGPHEYLLTCILLAYFLDLRRCKNIDLLYVRCPFFSIICILHPSFHSICSKSPFTSSGYLGLGLPTFIMLIFKTFDKTLVWSILITCRKTLQPLLLISVMWSDILCNSLTSCFLLFRGVGWDWVHLVRWPLIGLLYQPRMIDEYGAFGGMRIGRGNRSTWRKPAPVPLQIPHDLTWDRTQAAVVGSRRLTAWATARPLPQFLVSFDSPNPLLLLIHTPPSPTYVV